MATHAVLNDFTIVMISNFVAIFKYCQIFICKLWIQKKLSKYVFKDY